MAWLFPDLRVWIRGAGDLASGVALRLHRAGVPLVMTERENPLFVRRAVCFGDALYQGGVHQVEGVRARLAPDAASRERILAAGEIPIIIDPAGERLAEAAPNVIIDARMQKASLDTMPGAAPLVIALGPGYEAGVHCHAVIETNRGHQLGRIIWQGAAQADTGTPGTVSGLSVERVLRATGAGHVTPAAGVEIGSRLQPGDLIATVGDVPLHAPFAGVLRGLIHPSVLVWPGLKIGDLDPRNQPANCFTVSDKSLAIGGSVLEAILSSERVRAHLVTATHATP